MRKFLTLNLVASLPKQKKAILALFCNGKQSEHPMWGGTPIAMKCFTYHNKAQWFLWERVHLSLDCGSKDLVVVSFTLCHMQLKCLLIRHDFVTMKIVARKPQYLHVQNIKCENCYTYIALCNSICFFIYLGWNTSCSACVYESHGETESV